MAEELIQVAGKNYRLLGKSLERIKESDMKTVVLQVPLKISSQSSFLDLINKYLSEKNWYLISSENPFSKGQVVNNQIVLTAFNENLLDLSFKPITAVEELLEEASERLLFIKASAVESIKKMGAKVRQGVVVEHFMSNSPQPSVGFQISFQKKWKLVRMLSSGWVPYGPSRKITKAEDTWISEIDGVSALDTIRKYLDVNLTTLLEACKFFPICVVDDLREDLPVEITSIKDIQVETGKIQLSHPVEEGSSIRFLHSTNKKMLADVKECLHSMNLAKPKFMFVFSTEDRMKVLGDDALLEFEGIQVSKDQTLWGGTFHSILNTDDTAKRPFISSQSALIVYLKESA